MNESLKVDLGQNSYEIIIGSSLENDVVEFLKKKSWSKIAIITDSRVKSLYGDKLLAFLKNSGLNAEIVFFNEGEQNKTRKVKEEIEDSLLDLGFGRDSVIIALGGGITGDLAGFVASTFNRGISLIQMPTTLLAMVDSSVGGKTAVNTKYGKNLIGSFHQPVKVFVDLDYLETLPDDEFKNGLAELFKTLLIRDKDSFYSMEKYKNEILAKDIPVLSHLIKKSLRIKSVVVQQDEKESGLREILNLGHTIGHAVELLSKYKIKHGFAVSIGMAVESTISQKKGILEDHSLHRIINLLDSFSLPTKIPEDITDESIIEAIKLDKKSRHNKPRFVILDDIGKVHMPDKNCSHEIEQKIILESLGERR